MGAIDLIKQIAREINGKSSNRRDRRVGVPFYWKHEEGEPPSDCFEFLLAYL